MSTISTTVNHGIVLGTGTTASYTSPLTITSTGTVNNNGSGDAIYGSGIAQWTIDNAGGVTATGAGNIGIDLADGGTIANSGTVSADDLAVRIGNSVGTVTNSGRITASATFGYGVILYGGFLTNAAGGYIVAGYDAIKFEAGSATVVNSGRIVGTAGWGVELRGQGDTILNSGTIAGGLVKVFGSLNHGAVWLYDGGNFTNTSTGYLDGRVQARGAPATIVNDGRILSTALYYAAVQVDQTGFVTNTGTITASASDGVYLNGGGSLTNSGIIDAHLTGVTTIGVGTVENSGLITAGQSGIVMLGGTVDNSGTIAAVESAVRIAGAPGTVTNSGTIEATSSAGVGVRLAAGGSMTNTTGGYILGGYDAVDMSGAVTVVNMGTLVGRSGTGVALESGGTIINSGTIAGGEIATFGTYHNAAIYLYHGGSVTNTQSGYLDGRVHSFFYLESAPTLVNQGRIVSTYGAAVEFNNLGTVDNSGTITDSVSNGVFLRRGGSVTNSGTINAYVNGVFLGVAGTVTNSGAITTMQNGILASGGTVTNTGRIVARLPYPGYPGYYVGGDGIHLTGTGNVTNAGTIIAYAQGVYLYRTGTFVNSGTIDASIGVLLFNGGSVIDSGAIFGSSLGVWLNNGGYVGVAASGTVVGAVHITGTAPGTLINAGTITSAFINSQVAATLSNTGTIGTGAGISAPTGTLLNSGTIIDGVSMSGGAQTLIDSGTIIGGSFSGVEFSGVNDLLILRRGYAISGGVQGDISGTDTLELGGSAGASLTVNYNGLGLTNFEDVLFGSGGYDILKVSNVGGTLPVTISGFVSNTETIDLTGVGTNGIISSQSSTLITVTGSLGSETLKLDASDGTSFTTVSDSATGTELIACFARGTLIRTAAGEVPVEALKIGGRVATLSGKMRRIKWIGRRSYDGRFIRGNREVLPILIRQDALGDGVPARDLRVSPHHALYLDGVLVPAAALINGVSIAQCQEVERVDYFHLELAGHDVIFAEGAATETYVDCDNRGMFHNSEEFVALYPKAKPRRWDFCAPRVEEGEVLAAIRHKLALRLAQGGWAASGDPDLRLSADGKILRPERAAGGTYRFRLRRRPKELRILSRSAIPVELGLSDDARRLGVAVYRIVLSAAGITREIGQERPELTEGFHEAEPGHRWTDGDAVLPRRLYALPRGELVIEIEAGALSFYPLAPAPPLRHFMAAA